MRGDHIFVRCGIYSHHGIDCGNDRVIHFDSNPIRMMHAWWRPEAAPVICETDLQTFGGSRAVQTRVYGNGHSVEPEFSPDEVVRRAESQLGQKAYNLFGNNCEHFASWCKTGVAHSTQVDSAHQAARPLVRGLVTGVLFRAAPWCPPQLRLAASAVTIGYGAGVAVHRYVRQRQVNAANRQS